MRRLTTFLLLTVYMTCLHAYDIKTGEIYYDIVDGELTVVQGDKPYTGYVKIPDEVDYEGHHYLVTAIGDKAFNACQKLAGVRLPAGLRSIGTSAFASCRLLNYITLPDGVTTIGDAAFYGCTSIHTLRIPATVERLGTEALVRCQGLRYITVDEENSNYQSVDGVLFDKEGHQLLVYPNAKGSSYAVPQAVTMIADWAFTYCDQLEGITLPTGLQHIGQAAFYGCGKLTAVRLPATLTAIGLWAFSECHSLATITLPAATQEIGDGAFSFCSSLQNIYVENGNSHYMSADGVLLNKTQDRIIAFPGGRAGAYRIPSTVDSIGLQAFYGCNKLTSVTLPAGLERVNSNPFVFCDGLTDILVDHANSNLCSLEGVLFNSDKTRLVFYPNGREGAYVVPEGVTTISHGPFLRSELLSSLSLPTGLTTIGDWAFMGCSSLQAVSIPHSVESIGRQAFSDCPSLLTIFCGGTPATGTDFLDEQADVATLNIPVGLRADYMGTQAWGGFQTVKEFGLQSVGLRMEQGEKKTLSIPFRDDLSLLSLSMVLTLPEGITLMADGEGHLQPLEDGRWKMNLHGQIIHSPINLTLQASNDCLTGVHDLLVEKIDFDFSVEELTGTALQPQLLIPIEVATGTGIQEIIHEKTTWPADIYNLQGVKVRSQATSLETLPAGVYIIHGQKVIKK